jgi:RimJ/RimL family protein N-acetyltransferase
MRTTNKSLVLGAVSQYPPATEAVNLESWLMCEQNIALTNENKDVALFERNEFNPIAVYGHYFFWSRGRDAVKAAKQFLEEVFTTKHYGVEVIVGLTPVDNKAALWMNRRLGFKQVDTLRGPDGDVQMVTLTKQDWEQQ